TRLPSDRRRRDAERRPQAGRAPAATPCTPCEASTPPSGPHASKETPMTFHAGPRALPPARPAQEMDPRLARLLRLAAASGRRPANEIGPAAARAQIEAASALAPPGPRMARVVQAHAAGPGGRVPLRIYEPGAVRGTIVYTHGGGWTTGSIDAYDRVTRHLA